MAASYVNHGLRLNTWIAGTGTLSPIRACSPESIVIIGGWLMPAEQGRPSDDCGKSSQTSCVITTMWDSLMRSDRWTNVPYCRRTPPLLSKIGSVTLNPAGGRGEIAGSDWLNEIA
jgi:hypothetical protein